MAGRNMRGMPFSIGNVRLQETHVRFESRVPLQAGQRRNISATDLRGKDGFIQMSVALGADGFQVEYFFGD
jgi:hypothetical protein